MTEDFVAARHKALAWWIERDETEARCDLCCCILPVGEGYLFSNRQVQSLWPDAPDAENSDSSWLVCEECLRRSARSIPE